MSLSLPQHQRRIGLTGGIGMGKTTVSDYLRDRHQLPVLDADVYARDAVSIGSPILKAIGDRYGAEILLPDGQLDRRRLGNLIFENESERRWLEQQIHPWVRQQMIEDLGALVAENKKKAVLSVPLLFEANMTDLATEIWVVSCTTEQQLARLTHREAQRVGCSVETVNIDHLKSRIASQWPIDAKIIQADVHLDNSQGQAFLFEQIDRAIAD
jgi:dephospho-CoA kinase